MTTPPTTAPVDANAAWQQILDKLSQIQIGTSSPGIGLVKGEKAHGLQPVSGITTRGGANQSSANRAAEFGVPLTQYGTISNQNPYQPQAVNDPASGTPSEIYNTQRQLVEAGLLKPAGLRPGMWDDKSANAYKIVLAFANVHGMNATDAMNQFLANPAIQSTTALAPTQLTNPIESQNAITNQAAQMIGGGLSSGEQQDFASAQTGTEQAAAAADRAARAVGKTTTVAPPSPSSNARAYLLAHNQQDIVNYDLALRTMQMQQALKEL